MIYPVYLYGTPVLRKQAREIEAGYDGLDRLISDMQETMKSADGVGLAAPQIGKSIRLVVIDTTGIDETDEELANFKIVLINPEIMEESGEEWLFNEGCLSIPEVRENILRKPRIRLRYYDRELNGHDEYFEGIPARVIQHEVDHLKGVLFTDHLPPLKRKMLNGKLRNISGGKTELSYPVVLPGGKS